MSGMAVFSSNCPQCGQAITPMQMGIGHRCAAPDPRIMRELQAIKELLQQLLERSAGAERGKEREGEREFLSH